MVAKEYPPARLAWLIWGLGAALYLIAFYQRVAPAVLTRELMADFAIGAAALGNLSAFYFYSYVAMQVPTGILADRWGPRRLLTLGAGVAAAGSFLFALSDSLLLAGLGRLLIGGSVAVAFVCMLKLAAHWFAPRQYALSGGLALFIGIVGAVAAGVPLRLLVDQFGWRPVMLVSAVVTALVAIAIWWLVRDDPAERGYCSHAFEHPEEAGTPEGVVAGVMRVLRYRNVWLLFLVPGGVVGTILTFCGLWGMPYLVTHYRLETADAAAIASATLIAWALGGPLFGGLSDRIGRRKPLYVGGNLVLFASWAVALLVPSLPLPLLVALLLLAGFASGCMIIGFAFARESVPPRLSGTVAGIINMGVMLGPMILQPAVGWMLDLRWQGELAEGARVYGIEAYRSGFSLMLAWAALSLLLILFTRETRCRQLVER
ncbi:MAG: MFS transporter [Gammaproteobacteria bacterium]